MWLLGSVNALLPSSTIPKSMQTKLKQEVFKRQHLFNNELLSLQNSNLSEISFVNVKKLDLKDLNPKINIQKHTNKSLPINHLNKNLIYDVKEGVTNLSISSILKLHPRNVLSWNFSYPIGTPQNSSKFDFSFLSYVPFNLSHQNKSSKKNIYHNNASPIGNNSKTFWNRTTSYYSSYKYDYSFDSEAGLKANVYNNKVYEITIANKVRVLKLERKIQLVSPSFKVVLVHENQSSEHLDDLAKHIKGGDKGTDECDHYFGSLTDDKESYASIYECKGTLEGVIKTHGEFYEIHPIQNRKLGTSSPVKRLVMNDALHLVKSIDKNVSRRKRSLNSTNSTQQPDLCPFSKKIVTPEISPQAWIDFNYRDKEVSLELGIFCSHDVVENIYKELYKTLRQKLNDAPYNILQKYLKDILSLVQIIYHHNSIGDKITVKLSYLAILKNKWETIQHDSVDTMLSDFSHYQYRDSLKTKGQYWDVAILLTRKSLTIKQNGATYNALGYANQSVCSIEKGVLISIIEGFKTSYIVAHEIAHTLGIEHDGQSNSKDCDPNNHLMSPHFQGPYSDVWSQCSRRNFRKNLRHYSCLYKNKYENISEIIKLNTRKNEYPGQIYKADMQCKIAYGQDARPFHDPNKNICEELICNIVGTTLIKKSPHPALEGTSCAYNNWCISGKCVPKSVSNHHYDYYPLDDYALSKYKYETIPNGQWSQWIPIESCQPNCLEGSIGTRMVKRYCQSSNHHHIFRKCDGIDHTISYCEPEQDHVCRKLITNYEFADQICKQISHNFNGYQIPYDPRSKNEFTPCNIHCQKESIIQIVDRFPNGTLCYNHFDILKRRYCIKGICKSLTRNP
ncbi:A disintegrin and metalloproteinase with thrombospondin motifs adt-2-like [Gordionus sp. m RMFG-2023]|uniref:A disintegrin and metalloproteinase with thrombospondin motifs adt-2-like n=1 Tax=Gordionus sp. m RMFG-2023 TaxID=3053472 RepID=UPI0031FC5B15